MLCGPASIEAIIVKDFSRSEDCVKHLIQDFRGIEVLGGYFPCCGRVSMVVSFHSRDV